MTKGFTVVEVVTRSYLVCAETAEAAKFLLETGQVDDEGQDIESSVVAVYPVDWAEEDDLCAAS